ncbi:MAG: hypothetical protein WCU88_09850 [Elusimicrobiota bacterium]|jgi:hypothetical protein
MKALLQAFMKTGKPGPVPAELNATPAARDAAEPAYYEVWGGLESANRALWAALGVAVGAMLLSLVILRAAVSRPPVVIRVSGSGTADVFDAAGGQPAVSQAEVRNFLTLFERFFTEINCYTYDADMRLAFAMMTPEFQAKADELLKREGIIEKLKADQGKTTLVLSEVKVVRNTPQVIECKVKGYRQLGSYKTDGPSGEVVFEHDIILKKVPRAEKAPYGVLVEDYHESVFKR